MKEIFCEKACPYLRYRLFYEDMFYVCVKYEDNIILDDKQTILPFMKDKIYKCPKCLRNE